MMAKSLSPNGQWVIITSSLSCVVVFGSGETDIAVQHCKGAQLLPEKGVRFFFNFGKGVLFFFLCVKF